jgi:hypothetical protein
MAVELGLCLLRNYMYTVTITSSVVRLHANMVDSLLRSRLLYFDHIKSGAIIHQYAQLLAQVMPSA